MVNQNLLTLEKEDRRKSIPHWEVCSVHFQEFLGVQTNVIFFQNKRIWAESGISDERISLKQKRFSRLNFAAESWNPITRIHVQGEEELVFKLLIPDEINAFYENKISKVIYDVSRMWNDGFTLVGTTPRSLI